MLNQISDVADDTLLKEYQAQNKIEILEQLLLRYRVRLFNFIYRLTRDHALSEDILQEVSLRVIQKIKDFRPERATSFRQWLYKIAINLCRDNAKRKQALSNMELEPIAPLTGLPEFTPRLAGVATRTTDNRMEIEDLVAGLPKEQKEVILLKVYSGLTFREIAETLKCPLNTAISRMHYALKTLREKVSVYDKV
ncbi:MAG: sigma-70 family RNA polymerase sigma factor [Planctomycetota bacterium]